MLTKKERILLFLYENGSTKAEVLEEAFRKVDKQLKELQLAGILSSPREVGRGSRRMKRISR